MRAVSLSQEPAHSVLKDEVVCGYRDISSEPYSGFSGSHKVGGNAINTTNGAGPHNLQTFLLASDGTVMHCLPGYWNPSDLVREVAFAARIHDLYTDPRYSSTQKKQLFQKMQMAHIDEHPAGMVMRSRMQSFDQEYEAEHRLNSSDTILDRGAALGVLKAKKENGQPSQRNPGRMATINAFKTTDRIMHERMASRPFVPYSRFDVAVFSDYGRPLYDKNEDFRNARGEFIDNGRVSDKPPEAVRHKEFIGQVPEQVRRRQARMTGESGRPASNWVRGGNSAGTSSTGSSSKQKVLWGQSGSSQQKVLWGQR